MCWGSEVLILELPSQSATRPTKASPLVRAISTIRVRAERMRTTPRAVCGLMALPDLQAVDSSCAAMEVLRTSAGSRGVGDQLLRSSSVGGELQ